jgi:hypothetical protein
MLEILLQGHGTCRGTFGEQCGSQAEFEVVEYFHTSVDNCGIFFSNFFFPFYWYRSFGEI